MAKQIRIHETYSFEFNRKTFRLTLNEKVHPRVLSKPALAEIGSDTLEEIRDRLKESLDTLLDNRAIVLKRAVRREKREVHWAVSLSDFVNERLEFGTEFRLPKSEAREAYRKFLVEWIEWKKTLHPDEDFVALFAPTELLFLLGSHKLLRFFLPHLKQAFGTNGKTYRVLKTREKNGNQIRVLVGVRLKVLE